MQICGWAQEFFFPKEDEASKRQELWVKGLEPPKPSHVRGHSRRGSNLSVLSDGDSANVTATVGGSPTLSRPASPEVSHSRSATASVPMIAHQHTSSSSGESFCCLEGRRLHLYGCGTLKCLSLDVL